MLNQEDKDKEKKEFHEIELDGNYASNESAEDHSNVHDPQHHNDKQPIIPKQSERLMGQKRVAIFALIMIIFCALFVAAIYYTFFKMGDPKIFIYKGDIFVTKCPKFTFQIGNICHDSCPDRMYQRGEHCVSHCDSSDFVFGNFCIMTDCLFEEEDRTVKGYFDFSTKYCVKECSHLSFKFLDRFCFEYECPKEEIYQIVKQYNLKREDLEFEEELDTILVAIKDFSYENFVVTSNIYTKLTCSVGCIDQFNKFITYSSYYSRYECESSCSQFKFFYKKNGLSYCLDACPKQTFLSATTNECVDSCGQYPVENNSCILTCSDNLHKEGRQCVSKCSSKNPYVNQNNECVKSCKTELPYKYVNNGFCSSSCPKYIQQQDDEYVCIDKYCTFLLATDKKNCVYFCEDNEVEAVINNEAQCFEVKQCPNKMEFYVPGIGCQASCPFQYPIKMKGMCLQKCFENWSLYENECLLFCPRYYPYSQDGQCVTKCDESSFSLNYKCYQKCPQYYYQDFATKTCTLTCEGFEDDQNKNCHTQCPSEIPYHYQKKCLNACPPQTLIYSDEKNILQCLNECPPETFQTPDSKCVKQCPQNLFTLKEKKQCVLKCPIISDENNVCQNKCASNQRYVQGSEQCYDECPKIYFKMDNTNQCVQSCPFLQYKPTFGENLCVQECKTIQKYQNNMTCVDKCPKLYLNSTCQDYCPLSNPYQEGDQCVSQCSPGKIKQEKQCVDSCPKGLYFVEGAIDQCQKQCPQNFYIDVETNFCKKTCDGFTIESSNQCVKYCPYYSTQMGKECWLNSPQYPGPYLKSDGTILKSCDFEKGYYSNQRMCNKCRGGDHCKKCSQFYGICLECDAKFSLYNNNCYEQCPTGFISQQGVCIRDNQFLKSNLFFREYNQSNYFSVGSKIKYSILQDNQFIKNSKIEDESENDNIYMHTVVVHLHDLNSTYLDFYQYLFSQNNTDLFIESLKLQIIGQGISFITVQSPDLLYFSNFFDFVLQELLPSLNYFQANVVFSGIGLASNSIVQHVSNILNNQQDQPYRRIFGNYIVDMQKGYEGDSFVKDLTQIQYQEFQEFLTSDEDVYKQVPQICKIFTPYIRLNDIVIIKRNQKPAENLTNIISMIAIRNNCQNLNIKPSNSLRDYQRENNQYQSNKITLSEKEYGSQQRKDAIYKHLSENLLNEVSSWINDQPLKTSNEKLNQLLI
ncbi:hypothetical protein ABPG74_003292 [Tetrahymena malaccensis]